MRIRKRDGAVVAFDKSKIYNAVLKALGAVGLQSESTAEKVTKDVLRMIGETTEISVEEVQDLVENALMKRGMLAAAKAYILYRDAHARARAEMHVRRSAGSRQSVTDKSMLIPTNQQYSLADWDRKALAGKLRDSLGLTDDEATAIGKRVEDCLIATGLKNIDNQLVRDLVNNILKDMGKRCQLVDDTVFTISKDYVTGLIESKVNENSNIVANNPEAVNQSISGYILKNFALDRVFSQDVAEAHNEGRVYIHDLDFPVRLYCSSHSIEYLKKYGLKGLNNLNTVSKPAKSASVLTGHINTFLASMQAYYAGALGLGYVNVFYAPLLVGMDKKQLHQIAQEFVFNCSQNAFSRGSQSLFIDANVHTGVPVYLKSVPAVCAGGKYMFRTNGGRDLPLEEETRDGDWCLVLKEEGNDLLVLREHDGKQQFIQTGEGRVLTYKDFEHEAILFAHALLDVWDEGDAYGHVFEFPKCDFHVSSDTFVVGEQRAVYDHACRVASNNGSPYFVFDRDSVSLSSCCRLRVQITDMSLLLHPERLRTVGMQNVTINIPQAAYRAKALGKGNLDGVLEQIGEAMDLAVKAHLQKREFLQSIMVPGRPLHQVGKPANDGRPYVDLDTAMYIIGLLGVNDAVHAICGKEMHESDEAMDLALRITGWMYLRCKEYTKKYSLTFKLEESPAESATRKLAKSDLVNWREEALKVYKGGDEDHAYYTNSIHLSPDAPVDLMTRIDKQAMFNSIIEAGAIMHAFIGEQRPDPNAIAHLIERAFQCTQAAQIVFSPEFTYCRTCGHGANGLKDKCEACGSTDVYGETRVVGYYSRISSWNLSKLAEHRARQNGMYKVEEDIK